MSKECIELTVLIDSARDSLTDRFAHGSLWLLQGQLVTVALQLLVLLDESIQRQRQLLNVLGRIHHDGVLAARLERWRQLSLQTVQGVLDFFPATMLTSEMDGSASLERRFCFWNVSCAGSSG